MKSFLKFSFLILAISFTAKAYATPVSTTSNIPRPAPEIDAGLAISGLALLGGAVAVARTKRLKK